MASDPIPAWQQEALDKMHARLLEWLPDHKLHLVLIRAPFLDQDGCELTDPAFEQLLARDRSAAQAQLNAEFLADRLAGVARDKQREVERHAGAQAISSFVAAKRRSRHRRKAQPHSHAQLSIHLP